MVASTPSFVRMGANALNELAAASSIFLKLESGKPVEIVPLTGVDGILSYNQHAIWLDDGDSPMFPCFIQPWCPGEIIGDKPKFRAMLVCVTREEPDRQVILPMGVSLYKQLLANQDAVGSSIKGRVIKITKTGEKLSTRYTALLTGRVMKKIADMDLEIELIEHIGETDPDVVVEMLKKAGIWTKAHQAQYKELRKKYPVADADDADDDDDDDIEDDVETEDEEDETPAFTPAVVEKPVPAAPAKTKKAAKAAPTPAPEPVVEEDDADEEDGDDFEDLDE
jgi:hypothetical protein